EKVLDAVGVVLRLVQMMRSRQPANLLHGVALPEALDTAGSRFLQVKMRVEVDHRAAWPAVLPPHGKRVRVLLEQVDLEFGVHRSGFAAVNFPMVKAPAATARPRLARPSSMSLVNG